MKKFKISIMLMTLLMLISVLSMFTVAFAAEDLGSWQTKASMPTARYLLGAAEVNGKIYAIGGGNGSSLNTVEEYDPATDTWITKTSMLTVRNRQEIEVVEANGKIYAIGGYDSSGLNTVEEYDPATDTWTTKASMPTDRVYLGVAEVNGKIYAIGGNNGSYYLNTVEEYDPATDTWTTKASMPTARIYLGVAEVNGKLYAIGGDNGSHLNTVEEYDPATDTWTTKASMPTARTSLEVVEANSKIYAIGGYDSSSLNTVEEYDPATDTWTTKANMLGVRSSLGAAEVNGKIYAIGGYGTTYLNTVEEFTPPLTKPTPNAPTNLSATAGDSKVDLSWDSVTDAESYNVKRTTTSGGPYTTVAQEVYGTSYSDTNVINGTTYYYVVTAVNAGGESDNSNEASATPVAPSVGRALLKITMTNGSINEYDLSMTEVNDFITWYDNRTGGTGKAYYTIDKNYNIGPFLSRKDYIIFDKVLLFEVMEYTN